MCAGRGWAVKMLGVKMIAKNGEKRDNCHGKKGQPAVVFVRPPK